MIRFMFFKITFDCSLRNKSNRTRLKASEARDEALAQFSLEMLRGWTKGTTGRGEERTDVRGISEAESTGPGDRQGVGCG